MDKMVIRTGIRGVIALWLALAAAGCGDPSETRGGGGAGSGGGGSGGSAGGGGSDIPDGGELLPDGKIVYPGEPGGGCVPGQWHCDGNTRYRCADDGETRLEEEECPDACHEELGCVLCRPGEHTCVGTRSKICGPDGMSWFHGRDCAEWGSECAADGYCDDACGEAEKTRSYIGCEYWPVALLNTQELDSTVFDYRVVVGNPHDTEATVTVTRGGNEVWKGTVPFQGLKEIPLPWIDGMSFAVPVNQWSSFFTPDAAYRLVSDLPVTVAQFNPFEYVVGQTASYTNDATLLLPSHVLTGDYVGLSYLPLDNVKGMEGAPIPMPPSEGRLPGYIAVVGIEPEPTNVEVTVSGHVAAEPGGKFPQTPPGGTINFTVTRGEVVHIVAGMFPKCDPTRPGFNHGVDPIPVPMPIAIGNYMDTCAEAEFDLTGSRIRADRMIEVFGGHTCAYVPYTSQACDHLEVQLFPIQTWGKSYVTGPMRDAGTNYPNLVRVVAAFDNTNVTVDPPQGGVSSGVLNEREWVEFFADSPFRVTGSEAIQVGQFLLGQYYPTPYAERGDPAMTVLVPSEQYRSAYTFVTPTSYNTQTNGQSYVMVVRPTGVGLQLDNAPLNAAFQQVGGMEIATVPVPGGNHRIVGDERFGIIAFGVGSFTSYTYPGGLDLGQITWVPVPIE